MIHLYQMTRKWVPSNNVTVKQEVKKHDIISVQEMQNANFAQNNKYLDDDELRNLIIQIVDSKILDMTIYFKYELKVPAKKDDKIDPKHNSLQKLHNNETTAIRKVLIH